jgi:thiol-disulfide isomerase/thioredoxin
VRPRLRRGLATALALSVLMVACSGDSRPSSSGSPPQASLLPTTPEALPEFTPERFRGLLRQLQGTPVVVNFWGSWCGPCYEEAPEIARVARDFEGRVQFIGVDINDQLTPAREFIREFGWTFPSVFDPANEILGSLGLLGAPVTIVYDASGERVFEWVGPVTERQLTDELNKLLEA